MRKIVAGLFISLDGVTESPDQWHFPYFNDEMGEAVGSQMAESDAMLLGRVTFQEFAGYWLGQRVIDAIKQTSSADREHREPPGNR